MELIAPVPGAASESEEATNNRMDEDAFRIFYEKTSRSLLGYLWRVSGDRDLADDLLQEAYCRLLSVDLAATMGERETKSYLFRIATNLLHDHWRRQRRSLFTSIFASAGSDPQEPAIDQAARDPAPEAQTDLRSAFDQLKARERQLLWLAYVEGSSHKEIANSTGLRAGSIRLLLFRARKKLAGLLQDRGNRIRKVKP